MTSNRGRLLGFVYDSLKKEGVAAISGTILDGQKTMLVIKNRILEVGMYRGLS